MDLSDTLSKVNEPPMHFTLFLLPLGIPCLRGSPKDKINLNTKI